MLKKKALEPLIATILLIVVAVILVTIVLSWGQNFTSISVNKTDSLINHDILSDKQPFLRFVEAKNGMYIFDYYPPSTGNVNFKVIGYSLIGYNDYIPLEPEYTVSRPGKHYIPLGIVNEEAITISLLLEDGSYLTFKNIKNTNRAPAPSDCPTGFVPVPGNHLYGTVGSKGGFCVAQFEMKVDENGDGIGDSNTSCQNGSYGTWDNAGTNCAYNTGTRSLVSSAAGYPLTNISQTDSITACESSIGGHLITNEEWMTIARNIEIVSSNWSSGTIGTGYIYSGHNDGTPSAALAGDTNNSNGYYLTGQTSDNQRRTLTLTNGEVVWDLAGNVLEWNDRTTSEFYLDCDKLNGSGFGYCNEWEGGYEYSGSFENYSDAFDYVDFSKIGYKDLFLLNQDYNKDNGIGYFWNYYYYGIDVSFLRGGLWYNGTGAGVLTLLREPLYPFPFTDFSFFGFRCVVVPE